MITDKHLRIIIAKMCEIIDIDPDSIDVREENWYSKHTWTSEQRDDFEEWMANYLYNNKEARRNVMGVCQRRVKRSIKLFVQFFIFSYGWKMILKDIE
jgi:hypothetical protein